MNDRIKELLARPELERLNDWASIGPVQRAALEEFAELISDWSLVEMYLLGYEQAKMELGIVDALAKGKKAKP